MQATPTHVQSTTSPNRSRVNKVSPKHTRHILLLIGIALLLSGCTPALTDKDVLDIFAVITATGVLSQRKSRALTEFDHFVKHRIRALIAENSSWKTAPYTILANRIALEIDRVATFIEEKLGTPDAPGNLGGAIDSGIPAHVDLQDVAKMYVDDGQELVTQRGASFVTARRQRVRRIVWRAMAIHSNLWKAPSSTTDVDIQLVPLEEILNRRLRFVERMIHTDSAQGDRGLKWSITAAGGPWKDNMRTVLFEYPFLSVNDTSPGSFMAALTTAGLDVSGLSSNFAFRGPPRNEIRYKVSAGRVRPSVSNHWGLIADDYIWKMKLDGKTPAQIFDLFAPSTSPVNTAFEDFWERNWIFCDHMVSVLEVDALRFGLFRRTGNENAFNDAADDGVKLSVPIPRTGSPDPNSLMNNGSDYFEGVAISVEDLQIGDLVIIWNNYFFRTLFKTDFGLENSIISDITGDEPRNAFLVGHGAPEKKYTEFVGGLVGDLGKIMKALRKFITDKMNAADPSHNYVLTGAVLKPTAPFVLELIFWNPFDEDLKPADTHQELQVPGAWWIRVSLAAVDLPLEQALILFPKSVAIDTTIHTPPKFIENAASDYKDSVYIPLSMPKGVRGGWIGYFKQAKDDAGAGLPPTTVSELEDAKVDSDWAPGFHYAGPGTKIPVLRPKVRI